jgi:mannan endo-1,4-beta-mannosidase
MLGAAAILAAATGLPAGAAEAAPANQPAVKPVSVKIVDDTATSATRSLFAYLAQTEGQGILFGHQHDLTHGFTFNSPDGQSSDTKAAVGDYPAVFGWDGLILEGGERPGIPGGTDEQNIAALTWALQQGDARGGINTLSAHMPNFVTGGNFNDTGGQVVANILPGGSQNSEFTGYLDRIAAAVKGAKRPDGTQIPVIFRPWHENNGGWFWWGAGHATSAQYIELYRYTVEYLRDTKQVHNMLYAYSPNSSFGGDPTGYLKTYPGDEFVDILGYDAYDGSAGSSAWLTGTVKDLAMVVQLAHERGKVPAFTEFGEYGQEGRNLQWFTQLLDALKGDPLARQVSYMLTWANFGGSNHAYVPYPAASINATNPLPHPLWPNFGAYYNDPYTLFASNLQNVFSIPTLAVANEPLVHLVTPTDRQRVTSSETTIRVRVSSGKASQVTYAIDGGTPKPLKLDSDGFYSAVWSIDPAWLDNRSVMVTVSAKINGQTITDSAKVLLGEQTPLPAGWVDNFEGYAGDDLTLSETYSHINSNTTTLSAEHKKSGNYGLAYGYNFANAEYTGIGKTVEADWSGFSSIALWLQGDGTANNATLQIVADGVYFESSLPLDGTNGGDVIVPYSAFHPASWDTSHAGAMLDAAHLAKVTAFNLYLGHTNGELTTGVIYVDDIRAQ